MYVVHSLIWKSLLNPKQHKQLGKKFKIQFINLTLYVFSSLDILEKNLVLFLLYFVTVHY